MSHYRQEDLSYVVKQLMSDWTGMDFEYRLKITVIILESVLFLGDRLLFGETGFHHKKKACFWNLLNLPNMMC